MSHLTHLNQSESHTDKMIQNLSKVSHFVNVVTHHGSNESSDSLGIFYVYFFFFSFLLAPSKAPEPVSVDKVSENPEELTISWTPLDDKDKNGLISGYKIFYCLSNENSDCEGKGTRSAYRRG